MAKETFGGFPRDLFQFLGELSLNNEREWFQANAARYDASVRDPALAFIRAMAPQLRKVSPHFVASDKKVGGSLMRIHRDVRFSKDKSPYKTNVGIHFRHDTGKNVHVPGIYVHLEPGKAFLGIGLYHPEPPALASIRARIADAPAAWKKVRDDKAFRAQFSLGGDTLARPPRGFDPEHPAIEDLKRKDHVAVAELAERVMTKTTVVDEVGKAMVAAKGY